MSSANAATPSPVQLSVGYKLDLMGVAAGGAARGARVLDNLLVAGDVDLDAAAGWRGASAHASLLNNLGGQPNTLVGALQGVDNIEVGRHRPKLYEAWVDQALAGGRLDVRAGLYDTNSEFDVTDGAGIFLGPTYGISSELAATGVAGPSIFPSTALAVRANLQPSKDVYLRVAAIDAKAGAIGDPGGVDTSFQDGLLVIGEAAWTGRGKIALGAWGYTRRQDDIRDVDRTGAPVPRVARGAYVAIEQPILVQSGQGVGLSAFLRLGVSDGDTTPLAGAGAVGLAASHLFASRPGSALGVAVSWGELSPKYRANGADSGTPLAARESALEVTYADKLSEHLTLQPDLQFIHRPGGDPGARDALVIGMRSALAF